MQAELLFEGAKIDNYSNLTYYAIDEGNAGWPLTVPGMLSLTTSSNALRRRLTEQSVGLRFVEFREHSNILIRTWQSYENMERDIIPGDAVLAMGTVGIPPYYLPDTMIIDTFG